MTTATAPGPTLPRAAVFDCDGTIADTESLSDRAWTEVLLERGYRPTDADFRALIGHTFDRNWDHFASRIDLGDRGSFRASLRARFRELFETDLAVHDDVVATMHALVAAGVPLAVASSSTHAHVRRVLERCDLDTAVQVVVGADDVDRHKPHPMPYLAAAADLGVDPASCSAVEDTPVGVAAARGAGMFTVAVVRSYGDRQALREADRVVDAVSVPALVASSVSTPPAAPPASAPPLPATPASPRTLPATPASPRASGARS